MHRLLLLCLVLLCFWGAVEPVYEDKLMEKDLYKMLGLPRNASNRDIRSRYRKLARKYHPDKASGKGGASQTRFLVLVEAVEILSDEAKRRQYDARLARTGTGRRGTGTSAHGPPMTPEEHARFVRQHERMRHEMHEAQRRRSALMRERRQQRKEARDRRVRARKEKTRQRRREEEAAQRLFNEHNQWREEQRFSGEASNLNRGSEAEQSSVRERLRREAALRREHQRQEAPPDEAFPDVDVPPNTPETLADQQIHLEGTKELDALGRQCPPLSVSHWLEQESRRTCACVRGTRPMEDWLSCVPAPFCDYFSCHNNIVSVTSHQAMKWPRRLEHSRLLKWSQRVAKERRHYHREGFSNDTQRIDKEIARVRLAYALEAAAAELLIDGGKYGTPSYQWMFELDEMENAEILAANRGSLLSKVNHAFEAERSDELTVEAGEVVQVLERVVEGDPEWARVRRRPTCLPASPTAPTSMLENCVPAFDKSAPQGLVPRAFLGYVSPGLDAGNKVS